MRWSLPSLPITTTQPFSTVTRFTVLIERLINVPSLVSMTRRGPISGSGSTGGGFGAGVSLAVVSGGRGAGRRTAGLRPRVLRTGADRLVSTLGEGSGVAAGLSTGFASGVGAGVGSGVGAAATSVTGSSILAPAAVTRFVLRPVAGGSGDGVSVAAISGPPTIGSNDPPK